MITENVLVQFLIVSGTIATTYLTVKYKNKIIKKDKSAPRDRMDTIFDGYESLIKQQQEDINRKQQQLETTQSIIERLQEEIDQTRKIVQLQRTELETYKASNKQLVEQLEYMKKTYNDPALKPGA